MDTFEINYQTAMPTEGMNLSEGWYKPQDYPQAQGFSLVHSHGSHVQFSHSQSGLLHLVGSSLMRGTVYALRYAFSRIERTGNQRHL